MGLKTFGLMAVDWEERVNVERLRQERLARIKAALKKSELGSLLCFDMNNIRYITATHIGTWAMDKLSLSCGTSARRRAIIRSIAHGSASAPAPASRRCAAPPIRDPVWLKTWRKKLNLNWKSANCSTSLSVST